MKRFLTGMLCAGILTSQPAVTYAAETSATPEAGHSETYSQASDIDSVKGWPTGPNIEGQSAVLMDAVTDTILYSKNAKDKLYPASITKIMTALLACEYLNMDDTITMSQEAAYGIEAGSSSIYAETGEVFTVEQALMALMLESANEMALALAEKTSGSVKKFVELMNQRAAQLGCKNTHFNNPNGLPDETHYTTAGDMMKIAKAAWYNPRFRKFVTTQVYEIPPTNKQSETRYLLNHHKMMPGQSYAYDGVLGGKTGYTDAAGSTLVTYAKRGNSILIAVVLNSTNGAFPDTTSLLDYGFDNFEKVDLNIDTDPVPAVFLPCEKHLLKDWNNLCSFYYMRHVYVTVPTGTDVYQNPKKKKDEIHISYPDHDKYVSREFATRERIMKDREVTSTRCPVCHLPAKRKLRWFMNNPKVYYSISNCEEHGLIRGKIRIRKTEDEKYFAVKTLRFTDTEEAEELRERKEVLRLRRKLKRSVEKEI